MLPAMLSSYMTHAHILFTLVMTSDFVDAQIQAISAVFWLDKLRPSIHASNLPELEMVQQPMKLQIVQAHHVCSCML